MKKRLLILSVAVLMVVPFFITGCSRDDVAIVRVQLQNLPEGLSQNTNSFFEKVFRWFVPNAYAGVIWYPDLSTITVKITAPDLESIEFNIPKTETQISLEIPAGPERKITVIGYYSGMPGKNWGGHVEVNLSPGDEIDTQINMLPMTVIWNISASAGVSMSWAAVANKGNITNYNIYRATAPEGQYAKVLSAAYGQTGGVDNNALLSKTTYYYKICVATATSEGELSDYVSVATP